MGFQLEAHEEQVGEVITKQRPTLLVSSPMCTLFSTLTQWNWKRMHKGEAK